jgi:hypothetical protein
MVVATIKYATLFHVENAFARFGQWWYWGRKEDIATEMKQETCIEAT